MASNAYEYSDQQDPHTPRSDDQSFDNDGDRDDDQTTSAEYDLLLQEAIESDLRDTELTGCIHLGSDEHGIPLIVCIPRIGFDKHTVSEAEIKKMFLLFIRMADALIRGPFSIIYAHDGAQYWLQRQPIVFRFYKLLPRKLKRNLESMVIIHPNVGIKSFFAFSRVFLSKKFYEKLTYVESIFDFQKVISPMCLSLPYNYLLIEDEELALSSCGVTASLMETFDPSLKSTRLLNSCVNYLRRFGLQSTGLFRVSGDHNLLSLVKTRLEPSWTGDKKQYSECVIIGDKAYHEKYGITYCTASVSPPDTPSRRTTIGSNGNSAEAELNFLKRRDSSTSMLSTPPEKTSRPTSLFRMGGKLFQDGSSKEKQVPKPSTDRIRSLSNTGRTSLFSTTPIPEKRTSMRFGQSTMRFFGQTSMGSPLWGKKGTGPPIGVKSGVKSQSGATAEDLRDVASVSEMSCTSGDSTQASEDHEGKEKVVSLSSVVITDIDTVAQILKMILRDLPEPVITFITFESMMNICVQFEHKEIAEDQWIADVLSALSLMPVEHRETLASLISFLAEVAALSEFNSMDVSNLASIFSPTVMRPPMDSESLQNAFQELRRSKNILKLLITRATIAQSAEKRGSKENPMRIIKNDPSLSVANLHTNSILLNANANNNATAISSASGSGSATQMKEEKNTSNTSTPTHVKPQKKSSTSQHNNNAPVPTPPTVVKELPPVPKGQGQGQGHSASALSLSLPADAFITNRKRLNNRPMSVSLDSSMLSSFLVADTGAPGKLSPIKEHESNPRLLTHNERHGHESSHSPHSSHDGKPKIPVDRGRNSMGSAGMKSLPVKKLTARARPMSTSAATSTSLSYFLKMFMSPRENLDGNTATGVVPTVVNPGAPRNTSSLSPSNANRQGSNAASRQPSVPPSTHRRATPVIASKLNRP